MCLVVYLCIIFFKACTAFLLYLDDVKNAYYACFQKWYTSILLAYLTQFISITKTLTLLPILVKLVVLWMYLHLVIFCKCHPFSVNLFFLFQSQKTLNWHSCWFMHMSFWQKVTTWHVLTKLTCLWTKWE